MLAVVLELKQLDGHTRLLEDHIVERLEVNAERDILGESAERGEEREPNLVK